MDFAKKKKEKKGKEKEEKEDEGEWGNVRTRRREEEAAERVISDSSNWKHGGQCGGELDRCQNPLVFSLFFYPGSRTYPNHVVTVFWTFWSCP